MNTFSVLSSVFCRQALVLIVHIASKNAINDRGNGGPADDIVFTVMTSFVLHNFPAFVGGPLGFVAKVPAGPQLETKTDPQPQ
jgi:hypothetical protein